MFCVFLVNSINISRLVLIADYMDAMLSRSNKVVVVVSCEEGGNAVAEQT